MAAISLAIIGKNNEPLYLREFVDEEYGEMFDESVMFGMTPTATKDDRSRSFSCSIRQQFILHAALDRLEELAGPPPGYGWRTRPGADGMFVGLLCPVDELRVYGYVTSTKNKFILVVEDEALAETQQINMDSEVKALMKNIHTLYIEEMLNPFTDIYGPITSKRFDGRIQQYFAAFNQSEGMI
jgi:hypothetical protein